MACAKPEPPTDRGEWDLWHPRTIDWLSRQTVEARFGIEEKQANGS
jgi:hypothetical protein